jgi:hypothetical protein
VRILAQQAEPFVVLSVEVQEPRMTNGVTVGDLEHFRERDSAGEDRIDVLRDALSCVQVHRGTGRARQGAFDAAVAGAVGRAQ